MRLKKSEKAQLDLIKINLKKRKSVKINLADLCVFFGCISIKKNSLTKKMADFDKADLKQSKHFFSRTSDKIRNGNKSKSEKNFFIFHFN